jgi:hypothetical protein
MTWSQIHENVSFGLMMTSCHTKVKEKIASTKQKLKNRKSELNDIYERASLYDPRNFYFKYRYDEVLYFYREANNEDFKAEYKALYDHQAALYQPVDPRCLYDILNGIRSTSVIESTRNDNITPRISTSSNIIEIDSFIYDNDDINIENMTEFDVVMDTEQTESENILPTSKSA